MNESDPRSDVHYLGSSENKNFFFSGLIFIFLTVHASYVT